MSLIFSPPLRVLVRGFLSGIPIGGSPPSSDSMALNASSSPFFASKAFLQDSGTFVDIQRFWWGESRASAATHAATSLSCSARSRCRR